MKNVVLLLILNYEIILDWCFIRPFLKTFFQKNSKFKKIVNFYTLHKLDQNYVGPKTLTLSSDVSIQPSFLSI